MRRHRDQPARIPVCIARPSLLAAQADGANLLITPHAAFYLDEAFEEMRHLAAREVGRVLRGETPLSTVPRQLRRGHHCDWSLRWVGCVFLRRWFGAG